MIKRLWMIVLLVLLAGCGNANGPTYDLEAYDSLGSMFTMRLYCDKDILGIERTWIYDSARTHYTDFWMGTAAVHLGKPMVHNFGPPIGRLVLINTGDLLISPPSSPGYNDLVNVLITNGRVIGNTPMGPGNHYRALATGKDRWGDELPTIVLKPDKNGGGAMALDGLFTMLHYKYNGHRPPLDPETEPVQFHTAWAVIFGIDEAISEGLRSNR